MTPCYGESYDTSEPERVVAAAIIVPEGHVWFLPPPCRHHHLLWTAARCFEGHMIQPDEQGFWTSHGRFVERKEAGQIAIAAGQIKALQWPDELFSEDLW